MTATPDGSHDRPLRSLADLSAAGFLSSPPSEALAAVADRYAIAVTPAMAKLIRAEGGVGPVARQFLPDARELATTGEERADPIDDRGHSPVRGVVHRYPDRALLKVTGLCPVYCRFCFRREMVGPGKAEDLTEADLDRATDYLAAVPDLFEVIVTGGDPLVLSARRIRALSQRLARLPQIAVVRWHTRVPVVAPDLITPDLVAALAVPGKATWLAIHANHPRELTTAACGAIGQLADAGIALVSQTVLLRGVNDDVGTLADLMRAFVALRVKPYYLHHPDLAPGTGHFRLAVSEGQALVAALRGRLTGLAQPTYVLDVPDGQGKVPIGQSFADVTPSGVTVRDLAGQVHRQYDWHQGGRRDG